MHKFSSVSTALLHGISFGQILQWIDQYGLPLLLQVLAQIAPNLGTLTVEQVALWVSAALAALANGQPVPPFPLPVTP